MAKRLRQMRAGRLGYAVLYTQATPADKGRQRAEKKKASTEGQKKANLQHGTNKIEAYLFGNFCRDDFVLTLTYDDDHLPQARADAIKCIKKFIVHLRAYRKKYGAILKYIYVTEDKHGDGRLHHHMVVNGTGQDYETFRTLWTYGNIHLQNCVPRDFPALARYLTKEPREYGTSEVGKRTWTPSLNLTKPEHPPAEWVPDIVTLQAPPGAFILDSDGCQTEYGSYSYIKYILPDPEDYRLPREVSNDPPIDYTRPATT